MYMSRERVRGRKWSSERVPTYTAFVANLPKNLDAYGLKGVFGPVGGVIDASIPLRQGSRVKFGFVKFEDYRCLLKGIQQLNNRIVRGNRLVVQEARGRRRAAADHGWQGQEEKRFVPNQFSRKNQTSLGGWRGAWRSGRDGYENNALKIDEEVGGSNKEVEIVGEVNNNVFSKLMASLVGEVDEPIESSFLLSELLGEVKGLVDASYLQWNKIFLHFSSEDLADRAMLESTLLHTLFSSVRKWSWYDVCDTRLVWLEVWGVPPLGWKKSNFAKIASHWGNFICLENKIEEVGSYECMKILISTDILSSIKCRIKFSLENKVFSVLVQESSKIVFKDGIRCEEAVSHSRKSNHGETNPEADGSTVSSPHVSVNSGQSNMNIKNQEPLEVVPNSVEDTINNIIIENNDQPSPTLRDDGPEIHFRREVQETRNLGNIINLGFQQSRRNSDAFQSINTTNRIEEDFTNLENCSKEGEVGEKSGEAPPQESLQSGDQSSGPPPGFESMKRHSSVKKKGKEPFTLKVGGKRKCLLSQGRATNRFLENGRRSRSRQSHTSSGSITESIQKKAEKTVEFGNLVGLVAKNKSDAIKNTAKMIKEIRKRDRVLNDIS